MILPLCMQKSHSHCCQTRSPKTMKVEVVHCVSTRSQTGVTRRHRPSKSCGEDQMHRMLAVYSRRGHSLPPSGPLPGHYRISAQRTMWAGFAALGRSRLNSRKHNWTAPVELTAVQPSPWLYRESTAPLGKKRRNKTEREGPFPIQPKKEPQNTTKPKNKRNQRGNKERGGR